MRRRLEGMTAARLEKEERERVFGELELQRKMQQQWNYDDSGIAHESLTSIL